MRPPRDEELIVNAANRLFRAAMAIDSAEQVIEVFDESLAHQVRRRLRSAVDEIDGALHELREAHQSPWVVVPGASRAGHDVLG
jgi:hypothetical protein